MPRSAPVVQSGNYNYDKFLFTNRSIATQCVSVSLQATAAGNPGELQSAAYSGQSGVGTGGFQPGSITTNYLGDSGPGTATTTVAYQFNVPALADFEVVVTESNDGQGGAYNLTVSGCGEVVISSYAPTYGHKSGGNLVGMYGSGFSPTGVAPTVTFGANAATVINFQDNALALTVPANAGPYPAVVPVTVTAHPSGATATAATPFTYYDDISTTTTLTAAPNPSVFGEGVTLTATVALTSPSPAGVPAPGNVEFFDGATLIGSGAVNASNVATLNVTNLSVGAHNLTAKYTQAPAPAAGDLVYLTSTSTPAVAQVVNQAGTTTVVTSSTNPSPIGSSVTFTATVAAMAPGAGTPTGTVTFSSDGVPFATGVALDASGQATATTSTLALGDHTISVTYSGDTNFMASVTNPALTQSVTATGTAISIVASPVSPSTFGQSVTFTATLTSVTGGTPGGTVIFRDGPLGTSPQIGTTQTVSGAGTAAISIATLSAGTHTIRAEYSGDANHQPVAGSITYTVNAAGTTTTLTSSVNPSSPAQSVTFTATVTSTVAGTIGGTVTFKDGANTLGTPSTVGAGGVATLATTALTVGSHNITAVYGGAGNYGPSTSAIVIQVVRVPTPDAGPDAAEAGKDSSVPDAAKADTGAGTDSGSTPDSSVTPKTDAGSDAGDGVIAGGGGDDGCGCTTAGTPTSGALGLLMWAGVGILVARRRKRSSKR